MIRGFKNRTEAGRLLAQQLTAYANRSDVLVLGLPRGGVPVAFEVAEALNAPLDVCIVRKLGVPGHQELAMGAIAPGGIRVLNQDVVNWFGIKHKKIEEVAAIEEQELERRDRAYRGDRDPPNLEGRTVILVDDGIATGSTIRAAIAILRQQQPERIVLAVPVAPAAACRQLEEEVEEIVCLMMPEPFHAIGLWYDNFDQTTDTQVRDLLERANREKLSSL
jgi:putative phosphoribosyl transferase